MSFLLTGIESSSGSGAFGWTEGSWPGDPWQSGHNDSSFYKSDHSSDSLDQEIEFLAAAFGSTELRPDSACFRWPNGLSHM